MAQFAVPKQKDPLPEEINTFLGADRTNAPNNVAKNRSPNCPNMIRDEVGKVKKRDGIQLVKTYPGQINGKHTLYGATTKKIVHAGTKIYLDNGTNNYLDDTELYTTANDHISVAKQMNGKLWILDGLKYLCFDGSTVTAVENTGTIPVIIVARTPTGGGTVLQPINLIQKKRTEKFAGTVSDTVYHLTATNIDADTALIDKMNPDGTFSPLTEGTHFTVNRITGQVTFNTAPGESPIEGEDNVYITYAKTVTGYADRINKCDISIIYGLNGARDRLFVSGNPDLPHYDYCSEMNDPTYFGDLSYSVIGQDSSRIMNYSIVNDYLVTHKDNAENDDNTNLRSGTLINNEIVFVSQGSYQTAGALAKYSFANLENEPLYVTRDKNISAVTPSDVLGERFSQERSYYLSGDLEAEENLENAYACTHDRFYYLACANTIYVLDSMQYSVSKERPLSHRQYEGYYFPGVAARVMWEENGELYFGTSSGAIFKFVPGLPYDDDAAGNRHAISAWWDTPVLDGKSFADKKTFVYIAVRLASALFTGVRISAYITGKWNVLKDYTGEANFSSLSNSTCVLSNSEFSFSTDISPKTLGSKIKEKNQDKIQFRFENSLLNNTFGLYKILIEYTEGGKYRK
jgi:hypothetical protein